MVARTATEGPFIVNPSVNDPAGADLVDRREHLDIALCGPIAGCYLLRCRNAEQ